MVKCLRLRVMELFSFFRLSYLYCYLVLFSCVDLNGGLFECIKGVLIAWVFLDDRKQFSFLLQTSEFGSIGVFSYLHIQSWFVFIMEPWVLFKIFSFGVVDFQCIHVTLGNNVKISQTDLATIREPVNLSTCVVHPQQFL